MARRDDQAPGEQTPEEPKPLRAEMVLFMAGIVFFLPVGLIYGFTSGWEPVGTVGFFLLCGLYGLVGVYLWITGRRVDPRPEDNPVSDVDENAGEIGVYSPHSWWPLVLGTGAGVVFFGVAAGWWIVGIGAVIGLIGIVGQVYEFSRGQHAH